MTNTILMIQPVSFRLNEETTRDNHFQKETKNSLADSIQSKALKEFNTLVTKLTKVGIKVIVVEDTLKPDTPDSIFPNNWISFHKNGLVCTYPMLAKNRRLERREDVLKIIEDNGFKINNIIDYSDAEHEGVFLEGTGSIVLDRENKTAYCSLSERTNESLFIEFCEDLEYTPIVFNAKHTINNKRVPIYHTNVMMSVAKTFAIVCLNAIDSKAERKLVQTTLNNSKKEIIFISEEQLAHFAGNVLQLKGEKTDYLVMSTKAYKSLSEAQIALIKKHTQIIHSNISTIEKNGGGSVRCMITEIY